MWKERGGNGAGKNCVNNGFVVCRPAVIRYYSGEPIEAS
jgi:hypothetical protein